MKIIMQGNGVFDFQFEAKDFRFLVKEVNYEAAKQRLLEHVERTVDQELERMFLEFNKVYNFGLENKGQF